MQTKTVDNYIVYKHTFPNEKVYIGITKQSPQRRFESGGRGYRKCPRMWNAIQKYGWENVLHEVLYIGLNKEEAEAKEIELIAIYHSNDPEYGYNIENGGNVCGTHSDETRKKISNSNKGKEHPWACTSEFRQTISHAMRGDKNPFYGRSHSEESKKKISDSRVGNKWAVRKAVQQLTLEDVQVAVFETITDAHKATGISMGSLSNACNGIYKKAGGYKWRFIND